jgi:hypothetical protein
MKKKLMLSLACLFAVSAFGQDVNEQNMPMTFNWQEDTTEVTTINDIIRMQQDVTNKKYAESHYRDVWSRKGYFNISYNSATLTPDESIPTGVGGDIVPEFKSDWGVSLQLGRSYALHKAPIANMLQFNIDYSYIDLNVNHFKQEGDGNLYDSRSILNYDGKEYYYTPWNLEKYDLNYGMSVGPSISIAPFTSTNVSALHHIKLNAFFHVGYHVSLLYMTNDEKADINPTKKREDVQTETQAKEYERYEKMSKGLKFDLGHGLITSFGFSITWKFIGLGYERRSGSLKYQSLSTDDYSKQKYEFKSSTNRVFIQFRM